MFIELLEAEVRSEDELYLYGHVTVRVSYGDRILKAPAHIKFKKEHGAYRLINDTDWMNRYDIDPEVLGSQFLDYLKIK